VTLRLIGHVFPGHPFAGDVAPGEALRIMTGAAVPATADAVLPVEQTELVGDQVCVLGDVPPTKNVGDIGEDVSRGTVVLSRNRCLRPQDLGLLSSIGIAGVPVVRQPRVRLIITGNELLPPGATGGAFQTVDANSPMLRAFVERDGGIVVDRAFLTADDPAAILAAMEDSEADFVLVSGGSSVGAEDHAPRVLATHGELAIHGIAIRPGSPAGMGRLNNRLVFLLPGNPVSCLAAYDFFAGRAIRGSAGRDRDWTYSRRQLELQHKIASQLGRVDYVRVRVTSQGVEPLSIAGASTLSSTTRADGFVIVPAESEGLPEGSSVDVFLYD
jgi:molybdopterin molybdotransferase